MMSFKNFMLMQNDDAPPESFQARYHDYQLAYLKDFSDSFFETTKREEWFQARYNPVKLVEVEEANAKHAEEESAAFKATVLAHPELAIKGMRLGPESTGPAILNRLGSTNAPPAAVAAGAVGAVEGEGVKVEGSEEAVAPAPAPAPAAPVSAAELEAGDMRHCSGHLLRAICISQIHACCTQSIFRQTVLDALATASPVVAAPDRIVVGQPIWGQKEKNHPPFFHRSAWVIMPSAEEAKKALRALKELKVHLPGPFDEERGELTMGIRVQTAASLYTPKNNFLLHDWYSNGDRVTHDTTQALHLAARLDESRGVPEGSRLAAIVAELPFVAGELPTDRLDLAVSYLRRVHFFSYYSGKFFVDEAHMMTSSTEIHSRQAPYYVLGSSSAGAGAGTVAVAGGEAEAADEGSGSRKRKERDEEDGDETVNESKAAEEGEGGAGDDAAPSSSVTESSPVAPAPAPAPAPTPAPSSHQQHFNHHHHQHHGGGVRRSPIDRHIETFLAKLGPKMIWTDARDHDDAKTVRDMQDKVSDPLSLSPF
jgi:hypothetical protein